MFRNSLLCSKRKFIAWALLAAGIVAAPGFRVMAAGAAAPTDAIDGKKFHALLVGCTKYDNLNPDKWLNGPANDVDLVRHFFVDHLKLPPQSVVVLSEVEAAAHGETSRPTRANIQREIQKLIDTAQAGDQVVLLMAGHGAQQPEHEQLDPTYLKPDGLDQIFLPCDCGKWISRKRCVDRAIVDYELRGWCKEITGKKARLWVVLDSCCSGCTLRALTGEKARGLESDDLGIPKAELQKSRAAAAARRPASRGGESSRGADAAPPAFELTPRARSASQSPDYVGLYAAQRDESEMEMPMPVDAGSGQAQRPQGLLTYAIIDILSRTARPITYSELANLVRQRYPQWGRTLGPTPVVEGLARDRIVLGVTRWPGRSRRRWQQNGGEMTVNEGSVEGLTPGSILALYPSIDQPNSETVIGYAKVRSCELLDSDIALCRYRGMPIPSKGALPESGCFEIASTDCGPLRIKLAVDTKPIVSSEASPAASPSAAAAETLTNLAAQIKTAVAGEASLCEFVDDSRSAQWLVQMRDGKMYLVSKDAADIQGKLPPDASCFSVSNEHAAAEIARDMTRIARAQNLLDLTKLGQATAGAATDNPSQPNVELKLLRYKSKSDRQGTEIDLAKGPLTFVPGDHVGWRMTNLGKSDVAVSLLYIDAGFGITAIFPRAGSGTDNILTKNGGTYPTRPDKITANPAGVEHVVLIAVPRQAGSQPIDFSFLEQERLPKSRGNGEEDPALESPFGRLLKNAMYGEGGTRGLDTSDVAEPRMMLQTWRVRADSDQ